MSKRVIFIFLCLYMMRPLYSRTISPIEYGLLEAKNDLERYEVLLKTHEAAVSTGDIIKYEGIKQITIEIPSSFKSIPLPKCTDFAGVELIVRNNTNHAFLFTMEQRRREVEIPKSLYQKAGYPKVPVLENDLKLLIIEDQNPWVKKRKGHNYGAMRKDVILLENGSAVNTTVQSYSTNDSSPKFYYVNVTKEQKQICNLIITRSKDSKYRTNCIKILNQNNVLLKNITINTPVSDLTGDRAIVVNNATNIRLEDVTINGTYSKTNKSGYGISLNNVWNITFMRLKANGNWGVFGNNNVNKAVLEECDINRFDIHCYGRDVYCRNTVFQNLYNQFSSFYGTLSFDSCAFLNFVPVLFESSYAAYTHFNLIIKDCNIKIDPKRPYLINAGKIETFKGARRELSKVQWPDVKMKNVTINVGKQVDTMAIFHVGGPNNLIVDGIGAVEMNNVSFINKTPKVFFSNKQIKTKKRVTANQIRCDFNKLNLN